MKEMVMTIFLTWVLVVSGFAEDFRKAEWGMTKEQVKAVEETEPSSRAVGIAEAWKGWLLFRTSLRGLETSIWYEFENGELVSGSYSFTSVAPEKCNDFFDELVETVSKKYGKPKLKDIWKPDRKRSRATANLSAAVISGDLRRVAEWSTERTAIKLELYSEKYDETWSEWSEDQSMFERPLHLDLSYHSKQYLERRKPEKEEWIDKMF